MRANDRKRERFEQIVRLRSVERRYPNDDDLSTVRSQLERELGDVVSPSFAASVLGVSHTTVRRWMSAGEIEQVMDPVGRHGVSVKALLRLRERVDGARESGRARHVIEPGVVEDRNRAAHLDVGALVPGTVHPSRLDRHAIAQLRTLAVHRAIADRLDDETIAEARLRLGDLRRDGRIAPVWAERWNDVLDQPLGEVQRILGEDAPWADDLRQTSPFSTALSRAERRKVLEHIQ